MSNRKHFMKVVTLALLAHACSAAETKPSGPVATPKETIATAGPAKHLYLDVHELGSGKVTAQAVAAAHAKDLATQSKYGVDYKAYWLDETAGKIYCLVEAPSAEAARRVHEEAHGLVAKQIMEVTAGAASWTPTPGKTLFLDVHHLGAGKVTAADVAAAHAKDVAIEGAYDVKYLDYWVDVASGTVMCLVEAPDAASANAVHAKAHGLVADSIAPVSEGR